MQNLITTLLTAIILLLSMQSDAQVYGNITDESGAALPFTSIYIQGTSTGTTSNLDGDYFLELEIGTYKLNFQYIGYETKVVDIQVDGSKQQLDVSLAPQATIISEVVIAADAEDPAYRVIREAMKKREYYRDLIQRFSCDVYVKGFQKILDAPEKIMGQEIGDLDGALDSSRQGIVYLSESISKLYFTHPDKLKEVVHSSKVSGDDRGYSFNSAREMEFNIYENTIDFSRPLISPIANNAFGYYDYKLEGTFYDPDGNLINKIKLLPKRESDPSVYGHVYIVEDRWNVHSFEVGITAKSSQLYFMDSLTVNQVFVPVEGPDKWRLFSNSIGFKLSMFGFVLKGNFLATYSNYDLNSDIDDDVFNNQVFVVEKESNKRDSSYWEENRPVQLTSEEKTDYIRKDSIQKVHDSPAYKDSIDREHNKLDFGLLLDGYSYRKSKKHLYFNLDSPIKRAGYNTVQGFHGTMDISLWKYFDEEETRRIIFDAGLNYGLSEKELRPSFAIKYRPDRLTRSEVSINAGRALKQINKYAPIDEFRNTIYSLFARQNYPKYYDYDYLKLGLRREVANGLLLGAMLGYEKRGSVDNHSDYSFFYKDSRTFSTNNPWSTEGPLQDIPVITEHEVFAIDLNANIRFGQQYYVYPDRKFGGENKGPVLNFRYKFLTGIDNDISLHTFGLNATDDIEHGVFGLTEYFLDAGYVASKNDLQVMDYLHLQGNQFTLSNPGNYNRSFLMLPYYSHSTDDYYFQAHLQHHFNGFIMDKIPGISTAGLSLVAGAKYLKSGDRDNYAEFHLGIDKIGWHILRILRFDAVLSTSGGNTDFGYRIGLKMNASN